MISKNFKAFTLVELIVIIAILGIMGGSAVVGFGSLGERMTLRQAEGVIGDLLSQLETEILIEKYEKTTLYFQPPYLMAVSQPQGSEPILTWTAEKDALCGPSEHHLENVEAGHLSVKNERGELLELKAMEDDSFECLAFAPAKDLEWQVQLKNEAHSSPVIRFLHFALDPEKQGQITLDAPGIRLEWEAPYGQRKLYQNEVLMSEPISIQAQIGELSQEIIIEP